MFYNSNLKKQTAVEFSEFLLLDKTRKYYFENKKLYQNSNVTLYVKMLIPMQNLSRDYVKIV